MEFAFYLAAGVAVASTVLVITGTNPVHALLNLIVSLLAVACTFFALGAPFAGVLEVIATAQDQTLHQGLQDRVAVDGYRHRDARGLTDRLVLAQNSPVGALHHKVCLPPVTTWASSRARWGASAAGVTMAPTS